MRKYLHTLQARLVIGALIPVTLFLTTAAVAFIAVHNVDAHGATVRSLWVVALTLATAVVLSILIPLRLYRSIVAPLQRLSEATDELRKGTFTTLTPTGPTELAVLASYFNMMGLALSERDTMLRTAERRYQGLLGSFNNLLWSAGPDGNFNGDFAGWLSYTGQREDDLRNDGWFQAIHADDRDRIQDEWRKAMQSSTPFTGTCRIRRHDNVYRLFSCRCVPIFNQNTLLEWVCACTDITEREEQERLRREKDAAEAASRAKSAFLTRMSHELRTPLNAVLGMSKMLATGRFGELTDKQAEYLDDINKAGAHLLGLINDVLDISKVEAGQMRITPEPVAIGALLENTLTTVRPLATAKSQSLNLTLPQPDGTIVTDPARLQQVFLNLLSNAIKFTPAGGTIIVRAAWVRSTARTAPPESLDEAEAIRFEVEDNGIGIPVEEQGRIWDEFHQAANRQTTADGTGLGLALVRRLLILLGGTIWLDSAPGQGSRFSFVLPYRNQIRKARKTG